MPLIQHTLHFLSAALVGGAVVLPHSIIATGERNLVVDVEQANPVQTFMLEEGVEITLETKTEGENASLVIKATNPSSKAVAVPLSVTDQTQRLRDQISRVPVEVSAPVSLENIAAWSLGPHGVTTRTVALRGQINPLRSINVRVGSHTAVLSPWNTSNQLGHIHINGLINYVPPAPLVVNDNRSQTPQPRVIANGPVQVTAGWVADAETLAQARRTLSRNP